MATTPVLTQAQLAQQGAARVEWGEPLPANEVAALKAAWGAQYDALVKQRTPTGATLTAIQKVRNGGTLTPAETTLLKTKYGANYDARTTQMKTALRDSAPAARATPAPPPAPQQQASSTQLTALVAKARKGTALTVAEQSVLAGQFGPQWAAKIKAVDDKSHQPSNVGNTSFVVPKIPAAQNAIPGEVQSGVKPPLPKPPAAPAPPKPPAALPPPNPAAPVPPAPVNPPIPPVQLGTYKPTIPAPVAPPPAAHAPASSVTSTNTPILADFPGWTPQQIYDWWKDPKNAALANNYASAMVPLMQMQQNAAQYSTDFNEAARRWEAENTWNQNRDQYNMDLTTRQQNAAEGQAATAASQWNQQFTQTNANDAWSQGFNNRQLEQNKQLAKEANDAASLQSRYQAFGRAQAPSATWARSW